MGSSPISLAAGRLSEWLKEPDCKSGGARLRRFKSCTYHYGGVAPGRPKKLWLFSDFYWIPLDKCADIYYNGGKLNDTTSTKELSWNTSGTKTAPSQSTLPRASIRPNNSNTSQTPTNSLCVTCVCHRGKPVPPLVRHRITHFKENENGNPN